jgi:hypothetical protein
MPSHGFPAVVDVGQIAVVASTRQGNVGDRVVTAVAERVPVVELEPLARRASSLWSFSVTACSTMAARSPSGTEGRMRAWSRSSLS